MCVFLCVTFVVVGVALKYASLIRMRFGPSHVSRPYASSARRTLNQLARVRFPVDAYRTLFLFFLLEVITFFSSSLFQSRMIHQNESEKL